MVDPSDDNLIRHPNASASAAPTKREPTNVQDAPFQSYTSVTPSKTFHPAIAATPEENATRVPESEMVTFRPSEGPAAFDN